MQVKYLDTTKGLVFFPRHPFGFAAPVKLKIVDGRVALTKDGLPTPEKTEDDRFVFALPGGSTWVL